MFFVGLGGGARGTLYGVGVAEIAIAGKPAPKVGSWCPRAGSLPQERFLAANKITLMKLLPVRATVAHHMVIKNMALTL